MGILCFKCKKNKNTRSATTPEKDKEVALNGVTNNQGSEDKANVSPSNKGLSSQEVGKENNSSSAYTSIDYYFGPEEMPRIERMLQMEALQVVQHRQIKRYKKGNLIGEGSYGRVYEGLDEDRGQLIAIKEIDIRRISTNRSLEAKISSFQSEIDILSHLNHKNIVPYFGTNKTNEHFHIFLEFCAGGSIAKMLDLFHSFNENVIKKYTRQMLEGLEYLHAHNVIHRDIKGANILVDRDGVCKLSDFGGAKVIREDVEFKQQNSFKGTPNWMAPETVKNLEYTRFSDIWSIGCTVIEMATGEPPWKEYKNAMATLYNLMHTNTPPEFPNNLSGTCTHFLSCCLKINPKERLNVSKLLMHPFIIGEISFQFAVKSNEEENRKNYEESKIGGMEEATNMGTGNFAMSGVNSPRKDGNMLKTKDIELQETERKEIVDGDDGKKKISLRLPRKFQKQSP